MSRSKRAARDSLYSMLHSLFTAVKVRLLLAARHGRAAQR